ncbi:MAG: hypothetical protein AAB590_00310 [Patescibacteria group bacterium]
MNKTAVSNVQGTRGTIRNQILEYISRFKEVSVGMLIEASEREVKFKSLGGKHYSLRSYIPTATKRLIHNGLLEWKKTKTGKFYLTITEKGRAQMFSDLLSFNNEQKQVKQKWDNQWRIIIFDIKEMKRFWRGRLRAELRKLGFVMIQQSVWLSPYACEDLIALLKTDLRVGKEVIYLTTKRFDGDIWLRKHYRLT